MVFDRLDRKQRATKSPSDDTGSTAAMTKFLPSKVVLDGRMIGGAAPEAQKDAFGIGSGDEQLMVAGLWQHRPGIVHTGGADTPGWALLKTAAKFE